MVEFWEPTYHHLNNPKGPEQNIRKTSDPLKPHNSEVERQRTMWRLRTLDNDQSLEGDSKRPQKSSKTPLFQSWKDGGPFGMLELKKRTYYHLNKPKSVEGNPKTLQTSFKIPQFQNREEGGSFRVSEFQQPKNHHLHNQKILDGNSRNIRSTLNFHCFGTMQSVGIVGTNKLSSQ